MISVSSITNNLLAALIFALLLRYGEKLYYILKNSRFSFAQSKLLINFSIIFDREFRLNSLPNLIASFLKRLVQLIHVILFFLVYTYLFNQFAKNDQSINPNYIKWANFIITNIVVAGIGYTLGRLANASERLYRFLDVDREEFVKQITKYLKRFSLHISIEEKELLNQFIDNSTSIIGHHPNMIYKDSNSDIEKFEDIKHKILKFYMKQASIYYKG